MVSLILAIITAMMPAVAYIVGKFVDRLISNSAITASNISNRNKSQMFQDQCLLAVKWTDVTYVAPLKTAGTFGPDEQKRAKEIAIAKLKESYSADNLAELSLFFGTDSAGLDKVIDIAIEAAVSTNREGKYGGQSISLSDTEIPL